jgi:4-carboxymuconolactone decarboxylase
MTPAARAKFDAAQAEFAAHGTDGPEARPLPDRCLMFSQSGPPMIPGNYNNNYQIVQTRDYVTILAEMGGQLRIIPLDGRPALPSSFSQWMGISRGHWDGATLVIETANFRFNDRSRFGVQYNGMTDENLRIIERFTRTAPDAITYRATIEDPTVYTKPWTFEVSLEKAGGPVYEYACHEGNYAMRDMLSGARALEKPPAPKSKPSAAVDPQSGFRLPLPHRDQLDDLGRRLYDQATRQDGRNIAGLRGPNGIRLYSPRVGAFQRELNEYLRFEAGISGPTRELAILVTARELSSQFEWAAHEPVALREGLSPATIDIVKNRSSVAGLPESEAAVIQLGREIFSDKRVTPETFARAVKLWGPTGVVNLVSLMGAYSSTAALLTAFDMQLPEGQKPLP